GRLPDARIEVHHQGSILQTIRLPMRATSQRLTWLLAFLILLVPASVLYATVFHRIEGTVVQPAAVRPVILPIDANPGPPKDLRKDVFPPPPVRPAPGQPPITRAPDAGELLRGLIGFVTLPHGDDPKKENQEPEQGDKPGPGQPNDRKEPEPKKDREPAPAPKQDREEQKKDAR